MTNTHKTRKDIETDISWIIRDLFQIDEELSGGKPNEYLAERQRTLSVELKALYEQRGKLVGQLKQTKPVSAATTANAVVART